MHSLFSLCFPPIFPPYLPLCYQPITVQLVAFRITLGTNLEMFHAALSSIEQELTSSTHLIQFPHHFDSRNLQYPSSTP